MKKAVSIVIVCTVLLTIGTFSVFGEVVPTVSSNAFIEYDQTQLYYYITATLGKNYITEMDVWDSYSSQYNPTPSANKVVAQDLNIIVSLRNKTNQPILLTVSSLQFHFNLRYDDGTAITEYLAYHIDNFTNGSLEIYGNKFYAYAPNDHYNGYNIYLLPNERLTLNMTCVLYRYIVQQPYDSGTSPFKGRSIVFYTDTGIVLDNYPLFSSNNVNLDYDDTANLHSIDQSVKGILNAYTQNAQGASELTSGSDSLSDQTNTVHQQEQTWYNQNSQAIESTGLANFQFSNNQQLGLNTINTLFNQLWNSLGDWTFVYTFTLMISLTMYILRHRTYKASKNNKKDSS